MPTYIYIYRLALYIVRFSITCNLYCIQNLHSYERMHFIKTWVLRLNDMHFITIVWWIYCLFIVMVLLDQAQDRPVQCRILRLLGPRDYFFDSRHVKNIVNNSLEVRSVRDVDIIRPNWQLTRMTMTVWCVSLMTIEMIVINSAEFSDLLSRFQ